MNLAKIAVDQNSTGTDQNGPQYSTGALLRFRGSVKTTATQKFTPTRVLGIEKNAARKKSANKHRRFYFPLPYSGLDRVFVARVEFLL